MFYQRHITRVVGVVLMAALLLGGTLGGGARAQQQQQSPTSTQQDRNRPRRTGEPQTTPSPKPRDDEITLQEDEVLRVETDLTNVLFTAVDKQKRFVTTLKQEDISVTEDGQPQEIFTFARQTDLPLSLAILVDTSVSEERTLPVEKAAAGSFVDAVLRPDKDEAAVVSFTGEATLEQSLTGNASRVRHALDRVEFTPPSGYIGGGMTAPGTPPISGTNQSLQGSTAIWDAIWVTSDEILSQTSDKTRRAIILLTDGQDSSSRKKMDDAIDRALKADAVIYSIGIGDEYYGGINKGALRKLSERTGGRAFFPDNESELRAAFEQIQLELRSQYLVAYTPTNRNKDGSFRRVQIEIVNPELRKLNLKLTYRQGYFAKTRSKGE